MIDYDFKFEMTLTSSALKDGDPEIIGKPELMNTSSRAKPGELRKPY